MTAPDRRSVLAGLAALPAFSPGGGDPDLGPDTVILDPGQPDAQARLDRIFAEQERAHFTDRRWCVLLKPGRHRIDANIGFFTQIAGIGRLPGDTVVEGHVHAEADWAKGMALVNFWRSAENLAVRPPDGADRWAVSQAAPYRRIHLSGDLALDDGGWSSGGFIADSVVDGTIRSGSQQQWFTRTSRIGGWQGSNWNMVFAGTEGAPPTGFPEPPITTLPTVPVIREKPFLCVHGRRWGVWLPALRRNARRPDWSNGNPRGRWLPLDTFFIARPGTSAAAMNAALARGQHLLVTPGIYPVTEPLRVSRAGTVVLGLGLATLLTQDGSAAIRVADVAGVTIAGLLIDAGPVSSPVLVEVGPPGSRTDHADNPTLLADLFFRVGGAAVGKAGTCLVINSHHVIADHLWLWRADHGDRASGRFHVGWDESRGDDGLIVNGDDVTIYGLFVEHFRRHQVLWNGERGRTVFFQCELPYDPPNQAAYMDGDRRGWAAYRVADHVREHEASGLGIYANFTADSSIVVESAIQAPRLAGVRFRDVTTISLGTGKGTIAHLVNDAGAAARPGAIRQTLTAYP